MLGLFHISSAHRQSFEPGACKPTDFHLVELHIWETFHNYAQIAMSNLNGEESPTKEDIEPASPIEPSVNVAQPDPPTPPVDTPQTFKCEKCGATFADEGSAAAHIQTCKGTQDESAEDETLDQKPIRQPSACATPPSIA